MDSYSKKLNIVASVKFPDIEKELQKSFDKVTELKEKAKSIGGEDFEKYQSLKEEAKMRRIDIARKKSQGESTSDLDSELRDLESQIEGFESLWELDESFKELNKIVKELTDAEEEYLDKDSKIDNAKNSIKEELSDRAKKAFNQVKDVFVDFAKEVFSDAKKIVDEMASYNLGTSLTINREAREQALKFGLTDAENYAFSKAQEEMGVQSEEDLFYMNEAQREEFAKRMGYYADKYKQMSDSGFMQDWERYQKEMKQFKEEMSMDVAKFFIDNKDMIRDVMSFGLEFMKFVMESLGWIVDVLSFGKERSSYDMASATADIVNSHSVSNVNNSKSVNQTNNYSISSHDVAASNAKENYRQILEVFR